MEILIALLMSFTTVQVDKNEVTKPGVYENPYTYTVDQDIKGGDLKNKWEVHERE